MTTPEEILAELAAWKSKRRGRQVRLAALFDVKVQSLCDWFAGRASPKWKFSLRIQDFLQKSEAERRLAIGGE
jgi:hypothetical protein